MRLTKAIAAGLGALHACVGCGSQPVAELRQRALPKSQTEVVDASKPPRRGPWIILEGMVGNTPPPFEGAQTELLATPSDRRSGEPLFKLSRGAFDEQFWLSWFQEWSPDGRTLVFDASNGFDDRGFESRLFWTDFSTAEPSPPRRIPDLPTGAELIPGNWDPTGSALPIQHLGEVYVVRSDQHDNLTTTLSVPDSVDPADVRLCRGGEYALLTFFDSAGLLAPADHESGAPTQLPEAEYYELSPDAKTIALLTPSNSDAGGVTVMLISCDGNADALEVADVAAADELSFSPDSRYLEVASDGDSFVRFIELADPGKPAWQPEIEPYAELTWSNDSKFVLVAADSGLSVLDLEEQGSHVLEVGDDFIFTGQTLLSRAPSDDAGTHFQLIDPLQPGAPLAELSLDQPATPLAVTRDSTRAAFLMQKNGDTSLVRFVALDDSGWESEVILPKDASLDTRTFSIDGRGVFATVEGNAFELYWLAAQAPQPGNGAKPEAELIYSSRSGSLLEFQPWP
ncbi:MAG TPA: hypothetical protein VHM70_07715 [Polyangiaceae bacterium]|jgi:hypothetical protein|nr:hypothetical protein [Polyangiaceae bacterium]